MPNVRDLYLCCDVVEGGDWQAALKHLPCLHSLTLRTFKCETTELYDALRTVPSFRSLTVNSIGTNSFAYTAFAALTQLQGLTLRTPEIYDSEDPWAAAFDNAFDDEGEDEDEWEEMGVEPALHVSMQGEGPSVLRQLTGLTSLRFPERSDCDPDPPDLWQSQLASALTALTRLQHMELQSVWDGPVATALGQVTSLTKLVLTRQQPQLSTGLHLPGVKVLWVKSTDIDFLSTLQASHLQHLQGYAPESFEPTIELDLPLGNQKRVQQQAALLERCARGALRHCNHLQICGRLDHLTPELAVADLQAIGRCWRPDPSLVDGSSPHLQPDLASTDVSASREETAAQQAEGGWELTLEQFPCTKAALAALPQGLTRLKLM
jgi:hypothetical protein